MSTLVVDFLPAYAPALGFGAAAAHWWNRGHGDTDLEPWAGITLIVLALWPCVYFAFPRTLGKRARGLHVRGTPPRAWLRGLWAALPLAGFAWPWLFAPLVLDAVWPLFDGGLTLHDRLARTEVLRPVPEPATITSLRRVGAEGRREFAVAALRWAQTHARLDEDELLIAEQFRARAADDPYAAWDTWTHAAGAVRMPRLRDLEERFLVDEEYEDPELERLYDEEYEERDRALVAVVARFHA